MSYEQWNETVYGVALPDAPEPQRLLAWLTENATTLGIDVEELPLSTSATLGDELKDFCSEYAECNDGEGGLCEMIATIARKACRDIAGCSPTDGFDEYVGLLAWTMFPWTKDERGRITQEDVQKAVEPIVTSLYGSCPRFDVYSLSYWC